MRLAIARPLLKVAGAFPILCCVAVSQQSASAGMALSSIVQGMEKSQSEVRTQTGYQVIREYRLFGAKSSSTNAEVVAQVDFKPASKDYSIQKWSGSSRGRRIVQRVLDHEVEASKGSQERMALSENNYDFTLVSETVIDGRPCYVLTLKPKRKEKELISGAAWVDKRSFYIMKIEGETARAPSWWVKNVRVRLTFGERSGTWLQTGMDAVADVRLLGSHTLTSRILDYRGTNMSASTVPAPPLIQLPVDRGH